MKKPDERQTDATGRWEEGSDEDLDPEPVGLVPVQALCSDTWREAVELMARHQSRNQLKRRDGNMFFMSYEEEEALNKKGGGRGRGGLRSSSQPFSPAVPLWKVEIYGGGLGEKRRATSGQ